MQLLAKHQPFFLCRKTVKQQKLKKNKTKRHSRTYKYLVCVSRRCLGRSQPNSSANIYAFVQITDRKFGKLKKKKKKNIQGDTDKFLTQAIFCLRSDKITKHQINI